MEDGDQTHEDDWPEMPSLIDMMAFPDESLAALAELAPSPDSVHTACFVNPGLLSDAGRIDLLDVLRRQEGWEAARKLELLAVISRADGSRDEWSTQEIAAVLRIAPATAATQVHRAQLLTSTLAATLAALRAGSISARHADLLASAVADLDADVACAVEELVLERGAEQTLSQFRPR